MAALPGITTGYGSTHQGIEDLSLMRAIPGLAVLDPCDATEIQQAVQVLADYPGPAYLRILRGRVKQVFHPDRHSFQLGKAVRLRDGTDLFLISTGVMTDRALQVHDRLKAQGIHAGVLHVPTLKPLDRDALVEVCASCSRILTLENHTTVGGLGSGVAEVVAEAGLSLRMPRLGIPDVFVECGSVGFLTEKYGLSVSKVERAALDLVDKDPLPS